MDLNESCKDRGYEFMLWISFNNSSKDNKFRREHELLCMFSRPSIFDKGYISADKNNDYSYSWNESTIDVKNNTTEVVYITIKKNSLKASDGLEKVSQSIKVL